MRASSDSNFAGRLLQRLGENSHLIDAATGQTLPGKEVPGLIVGFAAGFLSNGLQASDRVLLSCDLSPASTLAYLGAMYAERRCYLPGMAVATHLPITENHFTGHWQPPRLACPPGNRACALR
jgi:hypothetical protein